jgi:hypothetical protein
VDGDPEVAILSRNNPDSNKAGLQKHMSWARNKFSSQEEKFLSEMLNFDQWRKGPIDVGALTYRSNAHNKIL